MPNVYMDHAAVVQTIGPDGIGSSPPVLVEEVEKIDGNIRVSKQLVSPIGRIPNPLEVDEGDVIKEENGRWNSGVGGGGGSDLPDVTDADNGKVLAVVDGGWGASALPDGNLPPVTSADNGKVLGVVDGEWAVTGGAAKVELNKVYWGRLVVADIATKSHKQGYQLKADSSQVGKKLSSVQTSTTYSASYYNYVIEIPEGAKHVEYNTYRSSASFGSLFLDEDEYVIKGVVISTGYSYRQRKPIPEGAKYFVYGTTSSLAYSLIHFTDDKPAYGCTELGLHVEPIHSGVINIIKNARQGTDFTWSAVMNIPRSVIVNGTNPNESYSRNKQDVFKANTEYLGAPYTDPLTDYRRKLLFISTPLECFITANKDSRSVQGVKSAYTARGGSYYGTCCTGLTSYAFNYPYMYSTSYLASGDFGKVFQITASTDFDQLMLADVLQHDGHCLMVSDIFYDANGAVEYIEVSEQTRAGCDDESLLMQGGPYGGISRRVVFTPAQIKDSYANYWIVRFNRIDKVKYTPTAYSPTTEGKRIIRPDYPLLPYFGSMCLLHQDDPDMEDVGSGVPTSGPPTCRLLIRPTSGYNKVVVMKNGVEDRRIDITSETGYVDVLCDTDAAQWSARLANYTGDTLNKSARWCYWYVTDAPTIAVSTSGTTATFTVTTKSEGFYPWFVDVDEQSTTSGHIKVLWDNYTEVVDEETGAHTFTFSATKQGSGSLSKYTFGLRSDKYGGWYFTGTF